MRSPTLRVSICVRVAPAVTHSDRLRSPPRVSCRTTPSTCTTSSEVGQRMSSRGVAVQVGFESKGLKPGFHFIRSRGLS
jgi:hypothetical protein